jgi:hypothetical protein
VHRVRRERDDLCASALEDSSFCGELLAGFLPARFALHYCDRREVQ